MSAWRGCGTLLAMVTHGYATMLEEQQQQLDAPRRRRMLAKEDPMSHRIIEKRRRDRMNNCLADLSRLIPADYLKKGRGRIEKTEIIEMAIRHIKYLQAQAQACRQMENHNPVLDHYRLGYQDCLAEALHFMVEVEGYFAGDPVCVQLVNHLQKHCDKILNGERVNSPRTNVGGESSSSSGGSYAPTTAGSSSSSSGFRSGSSPGSGSGSDGGGGKDPPPQQQHVEEEEEEAPPPLREEEYPHPHPPPAPAPPSSLYKFKNNIKQRFTAERSTTLVKRRCRSRSRLDSGETCSPPPSPKYDAPSPRGVGVGVPIFALHSKGAFYVPLTLDADLLAPHLEGGSGSDASAATTVLHPITISVSFQQPQQQQVLRPDPPWKEELTSSFPKWALCAQDRP